MSNAIRKIERQVILQKVRRANGNSSAFEENWKKYRESKYVVKDEAGNVITDNTPKNTMPKKQIHFDNTYQYTNMFAWADEQRAKREDKMNEQVEESEDDI